jgi:tRNA threonylcarbamoyladenosine biosynthesis protein TsaE
VRQPVTSPTFALVAEYRLPDGGLFVHMDLFRLHAASDLAAIGFQEYLEQGAIVAIEWPERAGAWLPENAQHVEIRPDETSPTLRFVTFDPPL